MKTLPLPALRIGLVAVALHALTGAASAQTACGASTGPDLVIHDVPTVTNYAAADGFDALSLGHLVSNYGDAWADYFASTSAHPVFGSGLYKLATVDGATRIEQLGTSWLLHGFFALSQGTACPCTPTDGQHLGIGCSDPSSASRSGSQTALGPRWQVDAASGSFPHPPASPALSISNARRLRASVSELEPVGGPAQVRYFGEKHVVAADDAAAGNAQNNASWRELNATNAAGEWTFSFLGTTRRESPALHAWQEADPAVQIAIVDVPGEGRFHVGWRVTEIESGRWRYEYALYNLNSTRAARSFAVPIAANVALSSVGFHDVAHHSGDGIGNVDQDGTDWALGLSGGALSWSTESFLANPNANALRWGTLYNFRFDADAAPVAGLATIGTFLVPGSVTAAVDVPGSSDSPGDLVCAGDGLDAQSSAACPCANEGALQRGCANSANASGARLLASGATSADTVVLAASGELASALSIFLQGDATIAATAFGDGLRCAGGNLKRLAVRTASGGAVSYPDIGDPSISATSAALGDVLAPGSVRTYQTYYRDPDLAFCPAPSGNSWNVTNAVRIGW